MNAKYLVRIMVAAFVVICALLIMSMRPMDDYVGRPMPTRTPTLVYNVELPPAFEGYPAPATPEPWVQSPGYPAPVTPTPYVSPTYPPIPTAPPY